MKIHLILINIFLISLFSSLKMKGQTTDSINRVVGKYKSYKWLDLPVTEMLYPEANSYVGKKMIINKNSLILFSDTIKNVKEYRFYKQDQVDFFRAFRHFDYRKLNISGDSLTVMTVICPENNPNPQFDIIVTKDFLVTEYRGYFYFFCNTSMKSKKKKVTVNEAPAKR